MIIEYLCASGHLTERIRKFAERDAPVLCQCGAVGKRVEISTPHIVPDGTYSYAPNIGSARDFERRQNALETGQKVIKRDVSKE